MTDRHRQERLRLVLAYEDLDDAERRRADELLAQDDELRQQLQRAQEIERVAMEPLPLDDAAFWEHAPLEPEAEAAERESLARLRRTLDLARDTSIPTSEPEAVRFPWWQSVRWRSAAILVPAAAAAVFLLIHFTFDAEKSLLRDLTVNAVATVSDPGRTGAGSSIEPGVFTSGQGIALNFHLEHDAYVVVYHVDPVGEAQLVFPQDPDAPSPFLRGGTNHVIPDPSGGESWILGNRTGQESFLVGIDGDREPDSAELARLVSRPVPRDGDRETILAGLNAGLAARMDQVERIDLRHID